MRSVRRPPDHRTRPAKGDESASIVAVARTVLDFEVAEAAPIRRQEVSTGPMIVADFRDRPETRHGYPAPQAEAALAMFEDAMRLLRDLHCRAAARDRHGTASSGVAACPRVPRNGKPARRQVASRASPRSAEQIDRECVSYRQADRSSRTAVISGESRWASLPTR